jgi:hypothetical protein
VRKTGGSQNESARWQFTDNGDGRLKAPELPPLSTRL